MLKIIIRTTALFLVVMLSIVSNAASKAAIPGDASQSSNDRSGLSKALFKKLGYKVRNFEEAAPSEWLQQQFQTSLTRRYQVKSLTPLKRQPNMFPRYSVTEEVYETEALAIERIKRL